MMNVRRGSGHMRAAFIAAVLAASTVLLWDWSQSASARSPLRGDDQGCSNTPNAENAIAACTRLYQNRGLGLRDRAIALGNRGAAYKMLGRYDEAIADFAMAVDLDPANPQYYCQRADLRARKGEISDAIADYTTALQKSPRYVWAYQGRGLAYLTQGNGQLALADLNEALRQKPANFNYLVARGRANNLLKLYDAAIDDFSKALSDRRVTNLLPKERSAILSQRAFALVKQDRVADAKTDSEDAMRLAPKSGFALGVSGLVEEKLGQKESAKGLFTRALLLEPNLKFAKLGLERLNQTETAVTVDESQPVAQSKPAAPDVEPDGFPSADGGSEMCAKYIPEIGRTVRISCAE
jgi:tetratricopeptide (TPR) repeat protein